MSADLNLAKQRLLEKLGPDYNSYLQLLGKWFRGAISKEQFDESARHLNKADFAQEHNKFWLAFFHHCANNASGQARNFKLNQDGLLADRLAGLDRSQAQMRAILNDTTRVKCLPNKMLTHMRVFVTAWELQLDSVDDNVSSYLNLALFYFLKNIITELICTKKAYRMRENRFKYAIGVKPINPYLSNSLKVFTSNLEYDPYQIESNKMNSSILDTCVYNDSLFSSRLYESQALYEYACSTTSISNSPERHTKRLKLSEIFINEGDKVQRDTNEPAPDSLDHGAQKHSASAPELRPSERRLTLYNLLIAFLTNKAIIPSRSLYSINLERIFTKLSC